MKDGRIIRDVITFDSDSKEEILSFFGKTVDSDGYIVDSRDRSHRITARDGKYIKLTEFAGIRRGKLGGLEYIRSDLGSLIELRDETEG